MGSRSSLLIYRQQLRERYIVFKIQFERMVDIDFRSKHERRLVRHDMSLMVCPCYALVFISDELLEGLTLISVHAYGFSSPNIPICAVDALVAGTHWSIGMSYVLHK